jgi:hypothetical protein
MIWIESHVEEAVCAATLAQTLLVLLFHIINERFVYQFLGV